MTLSRTSMQLNRCPDCGMLRKDGHALSCPRYRATRQQRGRSEGLLERFDPVYRVVETGPLLTLARIAYKQGQRE